MVAGGGGGGPRGGGGGKRVWAGASGAAGRLRLGAPRGGDCSRRRTARPVCRPRRPTPHRGGSVSELTREIVERRLRLGRHQSDSCGRLESAYRALLAAWDERDETMLLINGAAGDLVNGANPVKGANYMFTYKPRTDWQARVDAEDSEALAERDTAYARGLDAGRAEQRDLVARMREAINYALGADHEDAWDEAQREVHGVLAGLP